MKKMFISIVASLALILGIGVFLPNQAFAADDNNKICKEKLSDDDVENKALREAAGCTDIGSGTTIVDPISNLIQTGIALVGVIAVIVIIISGFRMMLANGEPGKVGQAKNAILFSVIALVVAVLAYAIVAFVSQAITSGANTGMDAGTAQPSQSESQDNKDNTSGSNPGG